MKNKVTIFRNLILVATVAISATVSAGNEALHTEDNEQVCQMNDLLATKIFVDTDTTLDGQVGVLSSKLLEMPTKNANDFNFKLFQVKLLSVSRARCPGCAANQIILYTADGVDDVINKLELTATTAKLTRNVDINGVPQKPNFVDTGSCRANEPE